jgi:hypothetical protein
MACVGKGIAIIKEAAGDFYKLIFYSNIVDIYT